MAAEDQVNLIIEQALAIAQQKSDEASAFAQDAATAAQSYPMGGSIARASSPASRTYLEPQVYIPKTATGVDNVLFNETYRKIFTDLVGSFEDFFTRYFPNEGDYLAKAQQWLSDVLDGKTGLPTAVEDQLWQRERSRVLTDAARASEELTASFASRGFPLPPGALQHGQHLLQSDAQNRIAQSSREVAIKQAELINENMKFAVKEALDYRIKAVAAAGEYIKVLALGPELAVKLATTAVGAQAQLISAASSYYNARIGVEELQLKANMFNAGEQNETLRNAVREFSQRLRAQTDTLSAAAKSLGDQAAAALNSLHASAGIQAQSITS